MISVKIESPLLEQIKILDYNIYPLDKCDKKTFISIATLQKINLTEMRKKIIDQVYIINKLYQRYITIQKQQFDNLVENYSKSYSQKSNKYYRLMINNEYRTINNNIQTFITLQNIVKQNIANYLLISKQYETFYLQNYDKIKSNQEVVQKLEPISPTLNLSIPNANYCKEDLDNKVKYLNNLYNETNYYKE